MKIAVYEQATLSAVSFYRSIGTFSYLNKLNKNIQVIFPAQISWATMAGVDVLYLERPQHHKDLEALELAKDFGIKIIVGYDDLLHGIPYYNPVCKAYTNPEILERIEKAITLADAVIVSTKYLAYYYSKFNENIHIIENALNDYKFSLEYCEKDSFKSINWRGSTTHRRDLGSVENDIFEIRRTYKDWTWTFIGNETWFITDKFLEDEIIKEKKYFEWDSEKIYFYEYIYPGKTNYYSFNECDVVTYFNTIKKFNSAIQICPLLYNSFNLAKSSISYLEGTYAGSVTIAPDLLEFRVPGCINYTEKEGSFKYYLEKAIKSKEFRRKKYKESYEYVKENLLLSKINKKRLELIEGLF